jgi:hypothetical protein
MNLVRMNGTGPPANFLGAYWNLLGNVDSLFKITFCAPIWNIKDLKSARSFRARTQDREIWSIKWQTYGHERTAHPANR